MRSVLRRYPIVAIAAALGLLALVCVALAPLWINVGAVRARIESAASSAVGGTLTVGKIDLSWFPRTEVVVHSVQLSVPGKASGSFRTMRASAAFLPLLRGKVLLSNVGVDGLDLAVELPETAKGESQAAGPSASGPLKSLRSLMSESQALAVALNGRLALSRPGRGSLAIEGLRVDARIRVTDMGSEITLSRLSMESPRLLVEGTLRVNDTPPRAELAARGSALDVTGVRKELLSFAGDDPTVAAIFAIVRGGTLTSFSFASGGKTAGELGALERMSIHASVADAWVRVPGPNLDLEGVSADVALEGGVLTAAHAEAGIGKSRVRDGALLLGLAKGDDRLRVEADVKADLAEVPAILARAIPSASFRRELALVEGLTGSATGRITIGDSRSEPRTNVDVSGMRFSARYRPLPWPVAVRSGRFSYDGAGVGVSGLTGSLGVSTFEGVAARVGLGRTPALEVTHGAIEVALQDFLEGARSIPSAATLTRDVRRLEGSLHVDVRRMRGPLARLGEASLSASGTFKEILIDSSSSSSLPPLSIASGRFAVTDDAIRVSDADARTLVASLRISGAWGGWRGGASTLEAAAGGTLGPEAIRWGWQRASLPAEFMPAAPIALHGVHLSFASGGALTAAGDFVVANGPRLTLDLAGDGKRIDVRNLTIADGDSTASVALLRPDAAYDLRFKGRLALSTVEKLFAEGQRHPGGIEGDFRALVPTGNLAGLTAEGSLTATGFEVSTPAGPVSIERADLHAERNRFGLASSSLVLGEQRFSAAGSATLRDGAIDLDMDVSTGDLAWTSVEKVLARLEDSRKNTAPPAAPPAAPATSSSPVVVGGNLRVSVDSFAYGPIVWKPVHADVRLDRDSVAVAVKKAEACDISTTGEARFLPGGAIALDARVNAAGPDINVPLVCLGFENVRATGAYEASAQVQGEGAPAGLVRSLRGPLAFKAAKGLIGKATLLTRILGVLNATDVFAGKSGGRVGEAMPYDSITVDGELAEGRVSIREAAMKTPSITMAASGTVGLLDNSLDLMVLSHPLSTVDKVVQAVPVVRKVLGRDFLAVAVKVAGTMGDPKVTITPGRDVGKGLIGILERTVTLPVTVFDPPAPNPIP